MPLAKVYLDGKEVLKQDQPRAPEKDRDLATVKASIAP
jgi:hypothetical protein